MKQKSLQLTPSLLSLLSVLSLALLASSPLPAAGGTGKPDRPAKDKAPAQAELREVKASQICMLHDEVFPGHKMLPVAVQGRTYYAYCDKCKSDLASQADERMATDPVSGKQVDKAKAVIAARPDGKVLYFENRENLAKYKSQAAGAGR